MLKFVIIHITEENAGKNLVSVSPLSPTSRNANKQEIIKAYRKLAQQWHPDNFQSEDEKKEAEKKFIDIAAAKEVLTDPGKAFLIKFRFVCASL